jgi:hypothetical protein
MDNPNNLPLEYLYNCPKCGVPFHARLHRNRLVKYLFPNWPIRRFFCGKCVKAYYVKVNVNHIPKKPF